jgi:hypothetical protein
MPQSGNGILSILSRKFGEQIAAGAARRRSGRRGKGNAEPASERTLGCVSERAQALTPASASGADEMPTDF